jgi:hypothetical protein
MTDTYDDTYDDLDDLDGVWHRDASTGMDRDDEVAFDLGDNVVFDDDPVADLTIDDELSLGRRLRAIDGFGGLDELEDDELFAPHGPDRRAAGRVSRRRTTTLLHASTIAIAAGIGAIVLMLALVILTGRLLTVRQLFFIAHSLFGILIVHAFAAGLSTLCTTTDSRLKERVRKLSTASMAAVAWLASATGTWFVYAGYRADAPGGADLSLYPREYLLSSPHLRFWETFAMEWKMHVGWITPFLATAVAFVALRYGRRLVADVQVRKMLTNLLVIAFAVAMIVVVLGSLVNVAAPNDFLHRAYHP